MKCKDAMTRDVEWVAPTATIFAAARIMRDHNLGFLPVCDDKARVRGVITDRDIAIRACADGVWPKDAKVEDYMTEPVVTCQPENTLRDVEHLMEALQVARVVVVDKKNVLQGVVSLSDVAHKELGPLALRIARKIMSRETPDRHAGRPHNVKATDARKLATPDERESGRSPSVTMGRRRDAAGFRVFPG